jgi:hypothetical protein
VGRLSVYLLKIDAKRGELEILLEVEKVFRDHPPEYVPFEARKESAMEHLLSSHEGEDFRE